jgi:3-phenylpropionate/trans-cinnamate dioxygenase ferredoxin reductase component
MRFPHGAIGVRPDAADVGARSDVPMSGVVVVGNGVSGYACAARLAERGLPVTMIGPGLPHDRPPLSKRALMTGRVPFLANEVQLADRGIRHVDGVVTEFDIDRRRLSVRMSDVDSELEVPAPILVWATGLQYPKVPIPGLEQAEENTTGLGLGSLVKRLAVPNRRIVVIGAGLIGTETAATLAGAHEVTLVDMLDRPLARFLQRVSDEARTTLDGLGVRFLGSCRIESAGSDADAVVIHTSTHGDLDCDLVVSAAGFRSSLPPELAGPDPRTLTIETDERLRVHGREGVWACGDCVSFPHPRWGRIAIPHWDHALWSGRHAAESILGSTEPYVREPYFFSDIGPLRIQQVGLADQAVEWDKDDEGLIVGRDTAGLPACVLLLNAPTRLREARDLCASATTPSG